MTRSIYQAALDGLRTGELDALHQLEPFCHPEVLRPGSRERPGLTPEQLAAGLSGAAGPSLAYTVSEDGREVQMARGAIRTSSDRALVLEMRRGHGTIHLETEGV